MSLNAPPALSPLPIDPLLPSVIAAIKAGRNVVLCATPGSGKTTRVPRALLDAGLLEKGTCHVLEPRRLAARLAASRVSQELGETLGQRCGYAVRFERKSSANTRILFVTEGLLVRNLLENRDLSGVQYVILDEFHERHWHSDVSLSLLRRLQQTRRPDLRLLVMSATLDAEPIARFLDADIFKGTGQSHPLEMRHLERPDDRPVAERVQSAVEKLSAEKRPGHTLIFLPGAAEIRACQKALTPLAHALGAKLLPLHGSLSWEAQQEAIQPSEAPKLILSTNVAESSVTLDGVFTVIDTGLAREAVHSPWSGLGSLVTQRISQARCIQRSGRAARQGPGLCVRLFTENEFRMRKDFDEPELQRMDLSEVLLVLHELGLDARDFNWFEAPPSQGLDAADTFLKRMQALDNKGHLTTTGKRMARLPLHPRLARLLIAGEDKGIGSLAALVALLLENGSLKSRHQLDFKRAGAHPESDCDLWPDLDAYLEYSKEGEARIRQAGLDLNAMRNIHKGWQSLQRAIPRDCLGELHDPLNEEKLLQSMLHAYVDRLGRLKSNTVSLLGGLGARMDGSSVKSELLVALDAQAQGNAITIKSAARVELEWLLEVASESLIEKDVLIFNEANGRVERLRQTFFEDLCVEEHREGADSNDAATARVLAQAALEKGLCENLDELNSWLDRYAFAARFKPALNQTRAELQSALVQSACQGLRSLKDLENAAWESVARLTLDSDAFNALERLAPSHIALPRRRVKVHYNGEAPWIESRLQDFLGLKEGPRVSGGAEPLVLHLLAPNGRAVQVTKDLAGFWQRAYRELRPQLSRRYPKHAWPENPSVE